MPELSHQTQALLDTYRSNILAIVNELETYV